MDAILHRYMPGRFPDAALAGDPAPADQLPDGMSAEDAAKVDAFVRHYFPSRGA